MNDEEKEQQDEEIPSDVYDVDVPADNEPSSNVEVPLAAEQNDIQPDLDMCIVNELTEIEPIQVEIPHEPPSKAKFQPKVPPTDYERFIYKCHDCMLGFKRRGKN